MQHAAVSTAGTALIERYWSAGTAPVLEILAEYDPFHPKDQWGELRRRLGDRVTSTVIENASHALFPEQPDAVAAAVLGYLETHAIVST
jgi:pimeloyl-ACP methyl ester carboxylesterase